MLEAVKNVAISTVDKAPSVSNETTQKKTEQNSNIEKQAINQEALKKQVEELNQALDMMNVKREFVIDKDLNEVIVKIVDTKENKVVRQIPPEEVVKLAKNIREMVGLLFDKTT